MATEYRMKSPTKDEIVEKCKSEVLYLSSSIYKIVRLLNTSQTNCGDCELLSWKEQIEHHKVEPPEDTIAMVFDVRGRQGAVRIIDKEKDEPVDGIGPTKVDANVVIVPWQSMWWYYTIGEGVQAARLRRKSS